MAKTTGVRIIGLALVGLLLLLGIGWVLKSVSASSKKVVTVWFTNRERHDERVIVNAGATVKLLSVRTECVDMSCLKPGANVQCDPNCGTYSLSKVGETVVFPKQGNLLISAYGTAPVTADVEVLGAK